MIRKIGMLFIIFFLKAHFLAFGQVSYEYSYDNVGNRIKRMVIVLKSRGIDSIVSDIELSINPVVDIHENVVYNIYPNPTKGVINIDVDGRENNEFNLYDIRGKQVQTFKCNNNRCNLDLSDMPSGIYILRTIYNNKSKEWKIIKE